MSDLVVVGAGFIGMSFALAAHKQGFSVEVYDRAAAPVLPKTATSKVIAVNPVSAKFLAGIGVWNLIPDRFVTLIGSGGRCSLCHKGKARTKENWLFIRPEREGMCCRIRSRVQQEGRATGISMVFRFGSTRAAAAQ